MRSTGPKALLLLSLSLLVSCGSLQNWRVTRDSRVIAPYVHNDSEFFAVFEGGRYMGGTAFVDNGGAAFFVKDGKAAYAVNDKAKLGAPDLPMAPNGVACDEAFFGAVRGDGSKGRKSP